MFMPIEEWERALDFSRSERHDARVYIQHCCEPMEERRERQKELYAANYVTYWYRAI